MQRISINNNNTITIIPDEGQIFTIPVITAQIEDICEADSMKIVEFKIRLSESMKCSRINRGGYSIYIIQTPETKGQPEHVLGVPRYNSITKEVIIKCLCIPEDKRGAA